MPGSVAGAGADAGAGAEDVVQETWLRWAALAGDERGEPGPLVRASCGS